MNPDTESLRAFIARFPRAFSLEANGGDRATNAPVHNRTAHQEISIQPPNYNVSIPAETGTIGVVQHPSFTPGEGSGSQAAAVRAKAKATHDDRKAVWKVAHSRTTVAPVPIDPSSLSPTMVESRRSRRAKGARAGKVDVDAVLDGWRSSRGPTWGSVVVKLPSGEVSAHISSRDSC